MEEWVTLLLSFGYEFAYSVSFYDLGGNTELGRASSSVLAKFLNLEVCRKQGNNPKQVSLKLPTFGNQTALKLFMK